MWRKTAFPPEWMRVGPWWTRGDVDRSEVWRIYDNDWYTYLTLGEEVAYADAESIVRAIRRKDLLNWQTAFPLPPLSGVPSLPTIDPDLITSVSREGNQFVVRTRNPQKRETDAINGEFFIVEIRDGRVGLVRMGVWVV